MKEIDLENYIQYLLNTPKTDKEILDETHNIKMLLVAYRLGLQGERLPVNILWDFIEIEEDIPQEYHILVPQAAILKSGNIEPRKREYLSRSVDSMLREFYNYFFITPLQ